MYNQLIMIGNLVDDPKVFETETTTIVNFTIATNHKYKDKQDVYFADCKAFGKLAEVCRDYLKKGSKVFATGRLTTETWEKEGQKRSKAVVNLDNVKFLSPKTDMPTEITTEEPF